MKKPMIALLLVVVFSASLSSAFFASAKEYAYSIDNIESNPTRGSQLHDYGTFSISGNTTTIKGSDAFIYANNGINMRAYNRDATSSAQYIIVTCQKSGILGWSNVGSTVNFNISNSMKEWGVLCYRWKGSGANTYRWQLAPYNCNSLTLSITHFVSVSES